MYMCNLLFALYIIILCILQVIGGVDSSLYVGDLLYIPLRREWYYEVIITDIRVNNISVGLDCKEVSSFERHL